MTTQDLSLLTDEEREAYELLQIDYENTATKLVAPLIAARAENKRKDEFIQYYIIDDGHEVWCIDKMKTGSECICLHDRACALLQSEKGGE